MNVPAGQSPPGRWGLGTHLGGLGETVTKMMKMRRMAIHGWVMEGRLEVRTNVFGTAVTRKPSMSTTLLLIADRSVPAVASASGAFLPAARREEAHFLVSLALRLLKPELELPLLSLEPLDPVLCLFSCCRYHLFPRHRVVVINQPRQRRERRRDLACAAVSRCS